MPQLATCPAAERMLRTVRWWLQCLWSNFGAPLEVSRSVRKPYNPILGEQFFCTWSNANSDWKQVSMVAEQGPWQHPIGGSQRVRGIAHCARPHGGLLDAATWQYPTTRR